MLKNKKLSQRLLVAVLAMTVVCGGSMVAAAILLPDSVPTVIFNGSILRLKDNEGRRIEPIMVDGKIYLPAEGVANLLGIQHEEGEEGTAIWHDPSVKTEINGTKEGELLKQRFTASAGSILVTMEHLIDKTVSMTTVEYAHTFNTVWIRVPEGRTGSMAITVGNTGKANVRENRAGKLVSSSTANTVVVDLKESSNVNVDGIQTAEGNDQMEEAENEWNGMPLTVKVFNDETDELLSESRLEKGHQVEILVVEITGVNTLRLEAHPDIEGWRAARAESAEPDADATELKE